MDVGLVSTVFKGHLTLARDGVRFGEVSYFIYFPPIYIYKRKICVCVCVCVCLCVCLFLRFFAMAYSIDAKIWT